MSGEEYNLTKSVDKDEIVEFNLVYCLDKEGKPDLKEPPRAINVTGLSGSPVKGSSV